jgi:type I restriction enzyme S subunit
VSFTESLDEIVAENRSQLLGKHATWERVSLNEVATILNGFPFQSSLFTKDRGVPLLRIRDILNGSTEAFFDGHVPPLFIVKPGDLIVGMDGDFNCAVWRGPPAALNQRTCRVAPRESDYTMRFLARVLPGYLAAINERTSSITVKHLSSRTIACIPLPLPPRAEQDRVAAALDEHLTRLDTSTRALRRNLLRIRSYRTSVLRAACEGRLVPTEAELARAEGREYEPADQLLARILKERRARWESDHLAKLTAKGKPPKDDAWEKKYVEPEPPDRSGRAQLPEGWEWATFAQITEIQGGIQKQPSRAPRANAYPFVRVANVLRGQLDLTEIHSIELFGGELDRLRLEKGDLLIVEGNGSPNEIGRMAVWNGSIANCVHQNHIIRARPRSGISASYVEAYWNSPRGSSEVKSVASSTTGLYTLSIGKISPLAVPCPPLAEQHRIVAEVERRLSIADGVEATIETALARAERLRQAILKRAFEGRLVPQDPNDEPASVLLERIRKQREAQPQAKPRERAPRRPGSRRRARA